MDGDGTVQSGTPDVVGIGALNLDHIASGATLRGRCGGELRRRVVGIAERAGARLRAGGEAWVDAATMRNVLAVAGAVTGTRAVVGGSAFNAVRAAAWTRSGVRLGFVGVAGRAPVAGVDIGRELASLGVDTRFVRRAPDELCGVCLSYAEEDGERTLVTHAGANTRMAEHLARCGEPLVRYLAAARVLHVACLVDDEAGTEGIARVLEAVRGRGQPGGRAVRISLDPGHGWSTRPGPAVRRLVALSDFLLVNRQEFAALGRAYGSGRTGRGHAAALLAGMAGAAPVIAVKRPDGVDLHRRDGNGGAVRTELRQRPLPPGRIEDATGAGDVFAGGLLTVLARDPAQVARGCRLGLAMARRKLQHAGGDDPGFRQVAGRFPCPGDGVPPNG